jgi:iron complex outermembrane recepter protein
MPMNRFILIFISGYFLLNIPFITAGNTRFIATPSSESGGISEVETTVDTLIRQLDVFVVEAFNRRQEIISIPGAVSSIGNVVLERENASVNILPALQYAPGIFAQQGATNTSRVVIRGTGARVPYATGKIRAYFNNIPLTNSSGITFIEDIDPSVIEQMEIIKGPAPSVYGAGLGGTIVINARQPMLRRSGISNSTQIGAYDHFRNSTLMDYAGERLATSLVYTHTQSDGYRENNEFRRDALTSVSQFTALGNTRFTTLFAFSGTKSHIPSSIDSTTYIQSPASAAANWLRARGFEKGQRFLGGVTATRLFPNRFTAHLSIFGLWHDEMERRPFDFVYEERYTLGSRLRLVHEGLLGIDALDFSFGGEFFRENYTYSNHENPGALGVQGDPFTDNKEKVTTLNFFTQTDGSFGPLNVSAGINVNFLQRNYSDLFNPESQNLSGIYDYGYIVSPRLALSYLYIPDNGVYVSISHGFAPPSLDETLTPEGFINPDILPEKSWNLEFGFRGKLWNNRFFYDLSLYRMQIQDLLVAQRVGEDAWVGRNAGESIHRGIESEVHWVAIRRAMQERWGFRELSFRGNLTINDFRFSDFTDRGNDYSGNKIPGVPDYVFFASIYAESPGGFYLMPTYRNVGSMPMNDRNSLSSLSYSVVDVTVGYKPKIWNIKSDIFFRINNVFNEKYASMILVNAPSFGPAAPRYYYPGLPIHFLVGVKLGIDTFKSGLR